MTKKIWFFAILLLVGFLITTNFNKLPATSWLTASDSSLLNTNSEQPITIGYSNRGSWWYWAIAESEGLFAKHGVNVELVWYDNYSDSMKDLAMGTIDGNCQTLSDTISYASDTVDGEVVVLVNDNSAGNDKIIADAQIEQIEDLKNKEIVMEAGVVEDYLLTLALEQQGMSRKDVDIIDVETGAAAAAFAAGQVDAVGVFPPFWLTAMKREGAKEIITSKDFPGAIPELLVVTQKLVKEQPEQVQALVDTWFDILDFSEKNPHKADAIIAKRANITREELQQIKAGTKVFTQAENIAAFSTGNSMMHLTYAADKTATLLQNSLETIEQKPELNKMFEGRFVEYTS